MSKACMLIHGFTGGPYEVEPLAQHLSSHGWECFSLTLAGHSNDGVLGLRGTTRHDWLESAVQTAQSIAENYGTFDLVGFSMGALIAAYIANRFPVRKLVLLSPAVIYISPRRFISNVVELIRSGKREELRVKHETPMSAVYQFMSLVRELKPEAAHIQVPTMIAQGDLDEVVHPFSAEYMYRKIPSDKELHLLPNSRHMICQGPDAGELFAKVEHFLSS